jgi:hypothetical protein
MRPETALRFAIQLHDTQMGTHQGLHSGLERSLSEETGVSTAEYTHSEPLKIEAEYSFVADEADME